MHLDITLQCPIHDSPRVRKLSAMFDVTPGDCAREDISAEVPGTDEPWDIGVIVGPSGTGKTTIARAAFGANVYQPTGWPEECAVVDCFGDLSVELITRVLTAVGFGSAPSWLKPHAVLSNGEKFRCELARALLSRSPLVVFDEYSSLVDRTVAKIASAAISKAIRAEPSIGIAKRFVAVTCHQDVVEWLEPDWVLDMSSQSLARGRLRRPHITLDCRRVERAIWPLFERHHYDEPLTIPNDPATTRFSAPDKERRRGDSGRRVVEEERRRMGPKSVSPEGWAGKGPPASLAGLRVSFS